MKRILLVIISLIFVEFSFGTEIVKMKLIQKIGADKKGFIIVPSIDKTKLFSGKIYVLSIKQRRFFTISPNDNSTILLLKKGEGPCELRNAYDFFFLDSSKVLFFNGANEFYIVKFKEKTCNFVKKISHEINFPSKIVPLNNEKIFVLKNIPPVIYTKKKIINLLYLYDLKKDKIINSFLKFNITDSSNLKFIRGEYGKGDIIIDDDKILVVHNQPDCIKIFLKNGKMIGKISTKFSWLSENKASIERIERAGMILERINSNKVTMLNLIKIKNKPYLLIRKKRKGKIGFYIGAVNIEKRKIIKIRAIEFDNSNDKIRYFKSYENNKFLFANDEFLFLFSME